MKIKIFLILITFLLINFAAAQSFCVDFDPPSSPELSDEIIGTDIKLTWTASIDIPDCSGINYYEIWKNNEYLDVTSDLTYTDNNVTYETYSYVVYAVDKAKHKTPSNEKTITLTTRGSSYTDDYSPSGSPSSKDKDTPSFIPTKTDTQDDDEDGDEITLEAPPRESFFSRMTGAVIGGVTDFSKTTGGKVALIFVSMIGILTVLISVRRHGLKKSAKDVETFSDKEA